jgi:hypothetical protein
MVNPVSTRYLRSSALAFNQMLCTQRIAIFLRPGTAGSVGNPVTWFIALPKHVTHPLGCKTVQASKGEWELAWE